jgi:histidinol-phosphatase (PHP family)
MIDYHVHTALCNHAQGTMEAYVRRALALGLQEICFLDHLTLQAAGRDLAMDPGEVPFYFQAVQTLKRRYQGAIRVKVGLEVDFGPRDTDRTQAITEMFAFDVIAGSVHFPGGTNVVTRTSDWARGTGDPDAVTALYLAHLDKMLDCTYFDVVSHIDLTKKFGALPSRSFDREWDAVLQKVKHRGLTVELNASGYDHPGGAPYPGEDILRKCRALDIGVTLGSDAHRPDQVGQHYDRCLALLRRAGYRQLQVFTRRVRRAIPLEPETR